MAVDQPVATRATPPRLGLLALLVLLPLLVLLLISSPAWAQGTPAPDTQDMIEALMPSRQRNLVVRPTKPDSAEAAAPAPAPTAASGAVVAPALPVPGQAPSMSLAIQFEINSSRVRPESGPVLGNLVAAMLSPDLKASRFVIEGHTDARGMPTANQRLSQERADEVRLFLVALGVHPARLKAVGKGSSEPANPRDPLSADNRRVRVVTLE